MSLIVIMTTITMMTTLLMALFTYTSGESVSSSCPRVSLRAGKYCVSSDTQEGLHLIDYGSMSKHGGNLLKTNAADAPGKTSNDAENEMKMLSFDSTDYKWFSTSSGESIDDMEQYLITFSEEAFFYGQEAIDAAITEMDGTALFIAFIPSSSYHLLISKAEIETFGEDLQMFIKARVESNLENTGDESKKHVFINTLEGQMKIAPEIFNVIEKQNVLLSEGQNNQREDITSKLNAKKLFQSKNMTQLQELEYDDGLNLNNSNLRSLVVLPSIENIANDEESRIGIMITVVETPSIDEFVMYLEEDEKFEDVGYTTVTTEIEKSIEDYLKIVKNVNDFVIEIVNEEEGLLTLYLPITDEYGYETDILDIIDSLATLPYVVWLEPKMNLLINNIEATTILQSGRTYPVLSNKPIWAAGITGKNQIVGLGDTGVDVNSCYFSDENKSNNNNIYDNDYRQHRKIINYRSLANRADENGHGTHTAGSLAGMCIYIYIYIHICCIGL